MSVNPLAKENRRKLSLPTNSGPVERSYFILTLVADFAFLVSAMLYDLGYSITGILAGAIMIPYCLIAFRRAAQTGAYEQLGDSCYYLGFLLTLIGLAISLYDLGESAVSNTAAVGVVSRFGAAIVTTLVGMIARIIIVQFETISEHSAEEAEDRVSKGMSQVAAELETSVKQFESIRKTTVNNINQATKAAETRLNKAVEVQINITEQFAEEAFKRHETIVANLEKNLNTMVLDVAPIKTSLEEVMQTIEAPMARLNTVLSGLGDSGQEAEQKWKTLGDQFEHVSSSLEHFRDGIQSLDGIAENLPEFAISVNEATNSFNGTIQVVEKLTGLLNGSDEVIRRVKTDISANLEDLQTLRSMVIEEHSAAVTATDEVYKRLSSALELINNNLATAQETPSD